MGAILNGFRNREQEGKVSSCRRETIADVVDEEEEEEEETSKETEELPGLPYIRLRWRNGPESTLRHYGYDKE